MLTLPRFGLVRPRDLGEALEALGGEGSAPLAGGTDLVPNMKRGLFAPSRLVSLRRVRELAGARVDDRGGLVLGACTTLAELADDALVLRRWPVLARAAASVGSPQIRARATLGGNVCLDTRCAYYDRSAFWRGALGHCLKTEGDTCHVVPHGRRCVAALSADLPPALVACGARVRLASRGGERILPLADFFTADGARNTVRTAGELLVDVTLPPPLPGVRASYVKVRPRGAIDFPALAVAIVVSCDPGGGVRAISVVVGALASRPRVVDGLDEIAVGRPLDAQTIERVAERARAACHPLPNVDVDADWRRAVLPVHVRRALRELASTA